MRKRALGLAVALVVGAFVVSASGAATTKAQKGAKIDVSTRAAVVHYLRSIHVNAKHVVIQRGLRNYAGANCPGKGWTCAGTRHTVVQIAKSGGQNRFVCRASHCAVVQISGTAHGVYLASRRAASASAPAKGGSSGVCIKTGSGATTGTGQSCTISQSGSGPNTAGVYENSQKVSGLVQTAQYTASITQQSSGSNGNTACVTQMINLDGSASNTNGKPTVVNLKAHQSVIINQDALNSGANTANQAANSDGTCATAAVGPETTNGLLQSQILTSSVNATGPITQNLDRNDPTVPDTTNFPCPNVPNIYSPANLCIDIEQNQNGAKTSGSGSNGAAFWQENDLTALANTPAGGTINQTQGAQGQGVGGLWGNVNQQSTGTSTFTSNQNEVQCEDAFSQTQPLPVPTNPALCATGGAQDAPNTITVNQAQYGPAGMGSPKNGSGRVHYYHSGKDPGSSSQTGGTGHNSYQINQNTTQNNDKNTVQKNFLIGGLTSSGNGAVNQNALIQNNPKEDVQTGTGLVQSQIVCNGSTSADCTKTLSTPKITNRSPSAPVFGTDATTFTFSNSDPTAVFSCSLDGVNYSPCNGPVSVQGGKAVGTQTYTASQLASGSHTFYVKTRDADNGQKSANADSATWVITPANPTIGSTFPPNPDTFGNSESISFSDADTTATFKCSLDGSSFSLCTSPVSLPALASGSHTFKVQAFDSSVTYASNSTADYTWVITPPNPTNLTGPSDGSTSPSFTFDDPDSSTLFQCSLDGAPYSPCSGPGPGSGSQSYSGLPYGTHTIDVEATAGNDASITSTGHAHLQWTILPPTPKIDPLSEPPDGTSSTSASFMFSDSDASLSFVCSQDGITYTACSPTPGPGPGQQNYTGLATGLQNFYVEATDGTHYSAPASYSWNILPPA